MYSYLARKTSSKFNRIVLHRLMKSRSVRAPLTLSKLSRFMKGKKGKVAVLVGTVTNDVRLIDVPRLRVAALRFTESARSRITKSGGECLTLDQLAMRYPTGKHTVLLRGPLKARKSFKYFGRAPGVPHSHTRPRVLTKVSERNRGFKGSPK